MVSQVTNVPIPTELVKELEEQAAKAGMSLAGYLAFIGRVQGRRHDPQFADAVRHLFTKYPKSLKRLAE